MEPIKILFGSALLVTALYLLRPHVAWLGSIGHPSPYYLALGLSILANGLLAGLLMATVTRRWLRLVFVAASAVLAVTGGFMVVGYTESPPAPEMQCAPGGAARITWETSEEVALARQQTEKKPLIIDFTAVWCAACKELEKYTFSDPLVIDEARRFIMVRLDFTAEDEKTETLSKKYGVVGLPMIVFLDAQGKIVEAARVNGFVPPPEFVKIMRNVK